MGKLTRIIPMLAFATFFLVLACEDDIPTQQESSELTVESIEISRNMETNTLHVQAHILPGSEAMVDSVWFAAYKPDSAAPSLEAVLYDDGSHGDMIPRNGWYSADISADFITPYLPPESDVIFSFVVFAQDADQQTVSSESVFRIEKNYPVRIDTVFYPDTVDAGASELVLFEAMILDSNGIDDIRLVQTRQTLLKGQPDTSQFFEMMNNGTFGDRIAGDNLFSAAFPTNPNNTVGDREWQVIAIDNGNKKDTTFVQFYIKN